MKSGMAAVSENYLYRREILPGEEMWILEKCRYEPQHPNDEGQLDGSNGRIVREMIRLN